MSEVYRMNPQRTAEFFGDARKFEEAVNECRAEMTALVKKVQAADWKGPAAEEFFRAVMNLEQIFSNVVDFAELVCKKTDRALNHYVVNIERAPQFAPVLDAIKQAQKNFEAKK